MASWCRSVMIIAAKIVVRKSFVGVGCRGVSISDGFGCRVRRRQLCRSTENGTVRPKPRWLLRSSEFPISVTDQGGGRSLRKAKRQGPHRSVKVSRAAQGPHRPISGPPTSPARDRDSCRRVTRPSRCAGSQSRSTLAPRQPQKIIPSPPQLIRRHHPSPIHLIPHHNSFASQAGNHRYEISRNAGVPRSPRWAPYRAPLVGHASSAVLATCIHHRPPHRSRNPKPFRIPEHRQTCVAVNALGGPSVPSLSGHCAANEEPSPPATASCRPDMRWAARPAAVRSRLSPPVASNSARAPSPRP